MSWKFNHESDRIEEAVGVREEEIPQDSEELFEALVSGEERDLVRAACTIFFVSEMVKESFSRTPLYPLIYLAVPFVEKKSEMIEIIYRNLKYLLSEEDRVKTAEVITKSVGETLKMLRTLEALESAKEDSKLTH